MKKLEKILIAIFIFIQIILDMLRKTNFVNIEILNISILELINIFLVLGIFGIVFLKNIKSLKKYILYFIILFLYLVLHYYNTTLFSAEAYPLQQANFLIETFHIFITYIIPFILLISIQESSIKKKDLIDIIKYFAFFMSFLIVILNFFKLSYQAYDNGNIIKYNFFDWFTYQGDNYYELTSKGLFYSGNQISAILLICLPITLLALYQEKKVKNYFFLGIQILAMYMLGTKVASLGIFLVFLAFFLIYIFSNLITKKEMQPIARIVTFAVVACACFLISPLGINYRMEKTESYEDLNKNPDFLKIYQLNCNSSDLEKEREFIKQFIINYKESLNIPDYIYEAYPTELDLKYWCVFLHNEELPKNDYRIMKTNILNSIYQKNNNKYDKWLGMGYTINYLYTEKDYSFQFYIYGIIGIIVLIGPFYFIILKNGIHILKDIKQKATIENLMLLMAPLVGLLTAYFSGHILERSFPMLIIAILTALSTKAIYEKEKD